MRDTAEMSDDEDVPSLVPLEASASHDKLEEASAQPRTGRRFEKSVPVTLITGFLGPLPRPAQFRLPHLEHKRGASVDALLGCAIWYGFHVHVVVQMVEAAPSSRALQRLMQGGTQRGPRAGAGKTTLVDRILTAQHGFRVAVILNEIGDEKGIEKALLQDEAGAHTPRVAATRLKSRRVGTHAFRLA